MLTNNQIVTKYANYNAGRCSQGRIKVLCISSTKMFEYLNKSISLITAEDINGWIEQLFSKGYSKNTIRVKILSVRIFFGWCSDQHIITSNPFNHIPQFTTIYKKYSNERRGSNDNTELSI